MHSQPIPTYAELVTARLQRFNAWGAAFLAAHANYEALVARRAEATRAGLVPRLLPATRAALCELAVEPALSPDERADVLAGLNCLAEDHAQVRLAHYTRLAALNRAEGHLRQGGAFAGVASAEYVSTCVAA
jgi:hypothetical protein